MAGYQKAFCFNAEIGITMRKHDSEYNEHLQRVDFNGPESATQELVRCTLSVDQTGETSVIMNEASKFR